MKKISLLIVVLIIFGIYSCERDDICSENTATTPHLIITFYNISDQDELKSVIDLRAFGINDAGELKDVFNATQATIDSIVLPLRTDVDETSFVIHRNYEFNDDGSIDPGNADTIKIEYDREEVYVSRACGFKTIFNNIVFTIEEETDDPDDDVGNWMSQFTIEAPNNSIANEATAHINIFH